MKKQKVSEPPFCFLLLYFKRFAPKY